jgi:hypothetical protein
VATKALALEALWKTDGCLGHAVTGLHIRKFMLVVKKVITPNLQKLNSKNPLFAYYTTLWERMM